MNIIPRSAAVRQCLCNYFLPISLIINFSTFLFNVSFAFSLADEHTKYVTLPILRSVVTVDPLQFNRNTPVILK